MNDNRADVIHGKGKQAITEMIRDMTNDDLKVILSVARPNGLDVEDPVIAGALARTNMEPGLRDWFVESQDWDSEIAKALGSIHPPAGLRERILSIGEAQHTANQKEQAETMGSLSRTDRKTPWLAMAAAAVLLVGGTFFLSEVLRSNTVENSGGNVVGNDGEVTPLANGVAAEFAGWQTDALQSVEQILAGKLESLPLPEEKVAWAWIDQQVPPSSNASVSPTPGRAIGEHIGSGEGVACLSVENPKVGHYALFCFKVSGILSHVAVFDGVREIPNANESGVAVQQSERWQTVSWVEDGRTMMLFFFPTDVKNPTAWAEELMNMKVEEA